jgi:signal transduction histidine kinase
VTAETVFLGLSGRVVARTARWRRFAEAAFYPLLGLYSAYALAWLVLGLAFGAIADIPALHQAVDQWQASVAPHGFAGALARAVRVGVGHSETGVQVVLDYVFSLLNVGLAVVLLRSRPKDWTVRMLVVGMIGSAGAFNLQAHADNYAFSSAFGIDIAWSHTALLHGVGGVCYVFALLMFPTGTLGFTRQARLTARAFVVVVIAATVGLLSVSTANYPHPVSFVVFFGLLAPVVGVAAQMRRYTGATSAESRQQSRVLVWTLLLAFGVAVVLSLVTTATAMLGPASMSMQGSDAVVFWTCRAVFTVIPGALLVGILRFRLWDVERLLNRTFGYGVLAVLIGTLYVVVLLVADWLLRAGTSNLPVQLVAAAAVVVALQTARVRVSALANRLVYGRRPPPYDVLVQLSALANATVSASTALPRLARVTAEGLNISGCEIRLSHDGAVTRHGWPAGWTAGPSCHVVPVLYGGERVGELAVDRAEVAGLAADQRRLLADLAVGAGLVLRTAQLTAQLENRLAAVSEQAARISVSRRRIIAEQEAERRQLERNLHDGAQPQLVAIRMTLGLLAHLVDSGDKAGAAALVDQLEAGLAEADRHLAELAAGLYPPGLRERGLVAALRDQADRLGVSFRVSGEGRGELVPKDVQAAVCLAGTEALQNAAKHAGGARIRVELEIRAEELRFVVADDGVGFVVEERGNGVGLQSMADRVAAVAGEVRIESVVGGGTRVSGRVPLSL